MKYLTLLLLIGFAVLIEAKTEVSVKGIMTCQKSRFQNAPVELWAKDSVDPKDLLATGHTDHEGNFALNGTKEEDGEIQPIVRIIHDCRAKRAGCERTSEYEVPKHKFAGYDMTYVALDIYTRNEYERCYY